MKKIKPKAPKVFTRESFREEFQHLCEQNGLDFDVFSDGPLNSQIAIVGEGPGESEIRQGLPFVGGSGNLLWDSLRRYGINRSNVYTTNVVKRQISLSRKGNEKHVVYRDELASWIGLLKWELDQLPNLRIIFAMGNYALEALTGEVGITNWRGSVVASNYFLTGIRDNIKIVVANNPAYAMRELKQEPVFHMDCNKLDLVNRNVFRPHVVEHLINPSYKTSLDFIRGLKAKPKPVSFDIETINGETACYGLSNDPHVAMCINVRDLVRNRFTTQQEADILLALQDLCDSHKIVAQNGNFDAYWTRLHDWLSVRIWHDTLLAHHTLYPQLPHNLAFIIAQYTTHPFYKDEGERWKEGGDIDSFWRYNCKDAALTLACHTRLERELDEQGLSKFFHEHVMRAQPHLVSATVHGLAVDTSIKAKIIEQCGEDVAKLKAEFHRLVQEATDTPDYFPNPDSWPQMKDLFFTRLKLIGRGTSTDDNNRTHIMKHPATSPLAREMLTALGRYKEENKFFGTYAEARLSSDNRMRCEYKQFGVTRAPGRLSSSQLLSGDGLNLQNQPERARAMYIADPGMILCYFDLAQAEARVVGWRANIEKWKEQFEQARKDGKYDAHRALASEMFKIAYDEVPTFDFADAQGRSAKDPKCDHATLQPTKRYTAKRCRHGLNYRMERFRLAEVTELPYHEASRAFALYHSITPELKRWWAEEERQFKKNRVQWNALGRRNKIIQRLDEDALSTVIAFYPQSTIGDKVTQVWYQCEEDDEWPDDARVCLDVHDNLVAISTQAKAKTCLKIMRKHAEKPIMIQDVWNRKPPEPLIIPAELKMSYPTVPKFKDGRLTFAEDPKGLHRWSHMKTVEL